MSRNQSLTKVVFVMPFIHIFKDPYKTSYQKSVILHFQTFSSNLLDFYIVSFPFYKKRPCHQTRTCMHAVPPYFPHGSPMRTLDL